MARFEIPEGWAVQAFQFALDCTPEQAAVIRRQFGGRRYARNWAVRTLREDISRYIATGEEIGKPTLAGLRKRWNRVKDAECVDTETGEVWWPQISKEAFADGIRGVVEGLDAAGMLRQKGLTGARARRRGLSDSALGQARRQLAYKTGWYGSRLTVADRWYPSSKTCHACGHVQDIGWSRHWTCPRCRTAHQRDDNAAINLARYQEPRTTGNSAAGGSALGPVRAAVKRGADPKTRPGRAGGDETRKGTSTHAGEQPRDGVLTGDAL